MAKSALSHRIVFQIISIACHASAFLLSARSAEKIVVIGDSLSKEYSLEFPLLNPGNPAAWDERNWLELLSEYREELVDIGRQSLWPDSRLYGHEYNFAFPGSTTSEWAEILTSDFLTSPEFIASRFNLNQALKDDADRVVIFLGANDLKNNYGTYSDGADPTNFVDTLISNMETLIDHVRALNRAVPIVLVNVPDVGATPLVIESHPDPTKRQRVTDMVRDINVRLQQLADAERVGYADVEKITRRMLAPDRFVIAGVRFLVSVDPKFLSNDPEYLFSPDGFHINTSAQLLVANEILRAFEDAYPNEVIIPPFATEELLAILGIGSDVSPGQWADAYGLSGFAGEDDSDGDGATLLQEFALGMDPRVSDSARRLEGIWNGNQLELRYRLRVTESDQFIATPQYSKDMLDWTPVSPNQIIMEAEGNRASITPQDFPCFLRLEITAP